MKKKKKEQKKYIVNKSNFVLLQNINNLQAQVRTFFDTAKQNYLSRISEKLKRTSTITNWSLLKTLKIPCIPPQFNDHKFVCDLKDKS